MPRSLSRRDFLQSTAILGAGLTLSQVAKMQVTPEAPPPYSLELSGNVRPVHDPVIIRGEDAYYLFCTGVNIPTRRSTDMRTWGFATPAAVFTSMPMWALQAIPRHENFWAPDISYFNGKYHLYYSVSSFGSTRSVIGLATNAMLDINDDRFEWVDEGLVIESTQSSNYNCIDPNLVIDAEGVPWLAFGSFWSGLIIRRLDYDTGKLSSEDEELYPIAQRFVNSGSVEGPFIIRKNDFYFLFASFDFCCRGVDSTYRVMVGRSEHVTGPYVDRDEAPMPRGGGTQVTFPTERWKGPGHCSVLQEIDTDYLVYHAYDAELGGTPTLRIDALGWDAEGWPFVAETE